MPPFGWRLSDQEVADVANFVRTSWGNTGSPVTATQVAKVRKTVPATQPEPQPEPLPREYFAAARHFPASSLILQPY
jgi:hypothetical protein